MNIFQYISDKTLALLLANNKKFVAVIKRHYEERRDEVKLRSAKAPLTDLIQQIETIEEKQIKPGVKDIANIADIKKNLSEIWAESYLPSQYFLSTQVIEELQKLEFERLESDLETSTIRKEKKHISQILFNELRIENTYRLSIDKIYADIKKITKVKDISNIKKQLRQVQDNCTPESRYFLAAQVIEEELKKLEKKISKSPKDEEDLLVINKPKIGRKLKNETQPANLHVVLNYLFSEIYILTTHGIKNKPPSLSKIEKQYIKDCITTLRNPKFNIYMIEAADRGKKGANEDIYSQINQFLSNIEDCTKGSNDDEAKEIYLLFLKFLSNTERYYKITPLFIISLTNTLGKFSLEEIFEYYLQPDTGLFFTMYSQNSQDNKTVDNLVAHSTFFIELLNNLANKEAKNKFSKDRSAMVLGFLDHMIPWENLDVFQISRLGEYDETSFMKNYVNLCLKLNSNDDISKLKIVTQAFNEHIQLIENPNNEHIELIDTSDRTPESKTFSIQAFENIVKAQDSNILTYYEKLEPNVRYELEKKLSQTLERCSTDDLQKLKQSANPNTTVIGFILNKMDVKKDTSTVELLNSLQLDFGRTGTIIQNTLASITKYIHQKATTQSLEPSDEANNLIKLFSFLKIKPGDFDNFQTTLLKLLSLNLFPSGDNLLKLKSQLETKDPKKKQMTEADIKKALIELMPVERLVDKQILEAILPSHLVKKEQLIQFLEALDKLKNDFTFNSLLGQIQKVEYNELFQFNLQLNVCTSAIGEASRFDFSKLSTIELIEERWQKQEDIIHGYIKTIDELIEKLPAILKTKKDELRRLVTLLKNDAGQALTDNTDKRKQALKIEALAKKMSTLVNNALTNLLKEIEDPDIDASTNFIDGCLHCVKHYMNLTTKIKDQLEKELAHTKEHRDIAYIKYNQKKAFIIETLTAWIEKEINKHTLNSIKDLEIDTDDTPEKIQQQIQWHIDTNPAIDSLRLSLNEIMSSVMNEIPVLYDKYLTSQKKMSPSQKKPDILASNQLLNEIVKPKIESLIMTKCSTAKRSSMEACYIKAIKKFKVEFPKIDEENYEKAIALIDKTGKKLITTLVDKFFLKNATSAYDNSIEEKKKEINDQARNLKIKVTQYGLEHFSTELPKDAVVDKWILTKKQKLETLVNALCQLLNNDQETINKVRKTQKKIVTKLENITVEAMQHALDYFEPEFPQYQGIDVVTWLLMEKHKLETLVNRLCELLKHDQDAVKEIRETQKDTIKTIEEIGIAEMKDQLLGYKPILPEQRGKMDVDKWALTEKQKMERIADQLCELLRQDLSTIKEIKREKKRILEEIEEIKEIKEIKKIAKNEPQKPLKKRADSISSASSASSEEDKKKPKAPAKKTDSTVNQSKIPANKASGDKKNKQQDRSSSSPSPDERTPKNKAKLSKAPDKKPNSTVNQSKVPDNKTSGDKKNKKQDRSRSSSVSVDDRKKKQPDIKSNSPESSPSPDERTPKHKAKPSKAPDKKPNSTVNQSKVPDKKPDPTVNQSKPPATKAHVNKNKESSRSTSPSNLDAEEVIHNALDGFRPKFPRGEVDGAAWLLREQQKLAAIVNPLCELFKKDLKAVNEVRTTQKNIRKKINKIGIEGMQGALTDMQGSLGGKQIMKDQLDLKFEWTETDKWLLTEKQKLEKIVNPLCELLQQDQEAINKVRQTQTTIVEQLEEFHIGVTQDALNNFNPTVPKDAKVDQWLLTEKQKLEKIVNKLCELLKQDRQAIAKVQQTQKNIVNTIEDIAANERKKEAVENKNKSKPKKRKSISESDDEKKPIKSKGPYKAPNTTGNQSKATPVNKNKEHSRSASSSVDDRAKKKPNIKSKAPDNKASGDKKNKQQDRSSSSSVSVDDIKKKKPDIKSKVPDKPNSTVNQSKIPAKKASGDKKIKPQNDRSRSASSSVDDRKKKKPDIKSKAPESSSSPDERPPQNKAKPSKVPAKPDIKPKKTLLSEMSVFNRPSRKQEESSSSPEQTPQVKKK